MSSIKKNIVLNGINTVTSLLFPVITFPYAARILMPEGIGTVNFLNSIVGYIILFTSLGIPLYAVKEVAKYHNDKALRDKATVEILLLSTILCLFGYIAVFLLAEYVQQIHIHAALFYVLSLSILFTNIGVNWFYQGVEDFKFITIRNIIFRTLSAACLFIFVRNPSDLIYYGIIIVGSTVGSNIINFIHLRTHLSLRAIRLRELNLSRHIRPVLQVFILNLIISLYIQLNSIMLGFISGDESVGFFTAGTKITHIALTLIGSITTVLLPRCTSLLQSGDIKGFNSTVIKSLDLTLLLSLPMAVGISILCVPVTMVFCGASYMPSIPVLLLNAPVIIFISLTGIMAYQILYPKNHIDFVIWSASGGALVNLVMNFILIPSYGAVGAAISTLFAEFIVFLLLVVLGKNYFPFTFRSFFNAKYIVSTAVMGVLVYLSMTFSDSNLTKLITGITVGVCSYYVLLLTFKDALTLELSRLIKNKLSSLNR